MKRIQKIISILTIGLALFLVTSCFSRSVTLDFNTNGGSPITQVVVKKGVIPEAPTEPTKSGYDFDGWYADNDLSQPYSFTAAIEQNTTVYARWTPKIYQVSWDTQGGSQIPASSVAYQGLVSQPNAPNKQGHVFRGWYTTSALTTAYTFSSLMPARDMTLYAKWEAGEFVVSFDTHGGSPVGDVVGFYQDTYEVATIPNRYGYTFDGWYLEETYTTRVSDYVIPSQDITLHAKWQPVTVAVSFVIWESNTVSQSVAFGQAISPISEPTRIGYSFQGWEKEGVAYQFATPITSISPIVLTAKWVPNMYTISFEENGGSNVADITQGYLSSVNSPSVPTKEGHTFGGWYTDNTFTQTYNFTTMPLNGTTVYAKWIVNNYTIQFNTMGGSVVASKQQAFGSALVAPTNPTKTGYTFAGWYLENTHQNAYVLPATMPAVNRSVYAKWNIVTYDITYQLNGGSASNPATYNVESNAITLNAPTKTGYEFVGWTYSGQSEPQISVSIVAGSIGDKEYTAVYQATVYNLSYNLNGGTQGSNPATYTIESENFTLLHPTKNGYTFSGWTYVGQATPILDVAINKGSTGNRSFTANYTLNTYTLTYNLNGGNATNPANYTIVSSSITLNNATKTGYTFAGWYDNAGFTGSVVTVIAAGSTGNLSLFAKFQINTYTMTYYVDGVYYDTQTYAYNAVVTALPDPAQSGYTFSGWSAVPANMPAKDVRVDGDYSINTYTIIYHLNSGNATNPATYTVEDAITLNDASKTGYTFAGWYDNAGFTGSVVTVIAAGSTGNQTFYAKYSVVTYAITYQLNDGTNHENNPATYTVEDAITLNDATKVGYTFAGWYDNAGFTGSVVTAIAAGSTGNKTLYAKYSVVTYTISYEPDGGSATNPINYTIESSLITLNDATKTGYTFAGWYNNAGFTGSVVTAIAKGSTGNLSLFAKFQINSYTITYFVDGDEYDTQTYNYSAAVTALPDPTKLGYTFSGWDAVPSKMPANDVSVYGTFNVIDYSITYTLNGGANHENNPATYTVEDAITLNDASKTGYTFAGWYDNAGFTGSVITTIAAGSTGNKTLYAKFNVVTYNINYELDGGENHVNNPSTYTVEDATFGLSDPIKTGYNFLRWEDASEQTITQIVKGSTGNKTLYAVFGINEYKIEYYVDGVLHQTIHYDFNEAITPLSNPTQNGYTFSGWDAVPSTMPANDVSVYGTFSVIDYSITYTLNGGTNHENNPATYTVEDAITLNAASKTGYTFAGWYDNAGFTGSVVTAIAAGSTGNQTLYAKFNVVTYNINYELDGGENHLNNPLTYTIESNTITLNDATKEGYTFAGWYDNAGFTGSVVTTIAAGSTGNLSLFAKFQINSYTITYFVDGDEYDTQTYNYNAVVTALPDPTQSGYTFSGWDAVPSTMPANDISVYGTFNVIDYSITYTLNDGTNHENNPATYTVEDAITLNAASKMGYTFAGWYDNAGFTGSVVTAIAAGSTGNLNLFAKFQINSYTITYFVDGDEYDTQTYNYSAAVTALPDPTKLGYTFSGWDAVPSTMPANDVSVYGTFSVIDYSITYTLNGGTNHENNPATYTVEDAITLNDASKTGYTFAGWYDNAGLTGSIVTTIVAGSTGNQTLYAKFNVVTYNINYELDGGENHLNNPLTYTIESNTITLNDATKEGYTFAGWYDNAGFAGSVVTAIAAGSTGNLSLFAKFQINSYTMNYYVDGVYYDTQTYNYNAVVTALPDPTQSGYTFSEWDVVPSTMPASDVRVDGSFVINTYTITYVLNGGANHENNPATYTVEDVITLNQATISSYTFVGWYDNAGFTGNIVTTIAKGSTGNKTLYAAFSSVSYTISYELNGGTNHIDNPATYTIESDSITLYAASKTGYTFKGWYETSDFSSSEITSIPTGSSGALDLYAKFEANVYVITYIDNGGDPVMSNPTSYTIESNLLTINDASKTGNAFGGWYDNAEFSGSAITAITAGTIGNITLYAKYEVKSYDVVFYSDTGEIVGVLENTPYGSEIDVFLALVGKPLQVQQLIELNNMLILLSKSAMTPTDFQTYFESVAVNLMAISNDMALAVQTIMVTPPEGQAAALVALMNQSNLELARLGQALDVKISLLTKLKEDMDTVVLKNGLPNPDDFEAQFGLYIYASQAAYATYSPSISSFITTFLVSGGSDMGAFMNLYSVVITELEGASRAKVSLAGNYPIKDGYSFVGWQLGSETKYLGWTEHVFAGTVAYAPASLGADPAKLVAKYARISEIIGTFNDISNMFSWSAMSPDTLSELYDSTKETISVEYNIYIKGMDNEIALFDTTSATTIALSYLGTYKVIVVPVVDIFRGGVLVNTITSDVAEALGRTITVIRAEGNASIESSGGYYHKVDKGGGNYEYYFFSNTEISFMNADFTILSGNEYVSVDAGNSSKLIFGNDYTTATQDISFTFTSIAGGAVHIGRIFPFISQFELGESLTNYLQVTNNMENTLYYDKTPVAYLAGKSYVNDLASPYYAFNEGNGFYLPLIIKTTGGVSINLPSTMLEYKVFKNDVEVSISVADKNAEVYRQGHYFYFRDVGETYKISVKIQDAYVPQALAAAITEKTFTVTTNAGANVYTNSDLKLAYGDVEVQEINIHKRIQVALDAEQTYVDPDDKQVYPYNFYQGALLSLYEQSPLLAKKSGDVYQRIIPTNLETPDNLVINGNYFTLDGSSLPYTNYLPGSIGLGSPIQTQAANLDTATGYQIRSVQIGIFSYMAHERNSMSDAAIYNSDVYGNVTFSNLTILGNTQTPNVSYGDNQSQIEEAIRLMGRNSGGYIGIQNFFNTQITTDNVVIGNSTLAIKSVGATRAILDKITVYNSWANGLYGQDVKHFSISNASIETSGGPAIHLEDSKYSNLFTQAVYIDSSSVTVNNWVSGEESWFKAYTMELASMQIKAQTNAGVSKPVLEGGLGGSILRSITDPATGFLSRKMNMLALIMPVEEQLSRTPEQIAAVPEVNRTTVGQSDMTIYIVGNQKGMYPYAGDHPLDSNKYIIPFGEALFIDTHEPALPLGDRTLVTLPAGMSSVGTGVVESMIGVAIDFSSVGRGHLIGLMGLDLPQP